MSIASTSAPRRAVAVTPSDTTILGCRALYVAGTGDLVVIMNDDYDPDNPTSNSVTLEDVPVGTFLTLGVAKVLAATTATKIVAFM